MRSNPVQFAVVREDPRIERCLFGDGAPDRVLLIASGGCTALSLQSWWPGTAFTLVDPNPAQLALVREKVLALTGPLPGPRLGDDTLRRFNVGSDDPAGLSQRGNFESLFRALRAFLHEFVAPRQEILGWFTGDPARAADQVTRTFTEPYWPVAFELHFHDQLLDAMFGPAATQYAVRGSYPDYFRRRLEAGLLRPDAAGNYFLHHLFLGQYLPHALPPFLSRPATEHRFEYVEGTVEQVADLASYDLVNLSNIMDWMSPDQCRSMVQRLASEMRPGSTVLWRQLNNEEDRRPWFGAGFRFDDELDARLAADEKSLFYVRVHAGRKTTGRT